MTSRDMLITFEELLRATNKDLEFDTNINTDVVYSFLTKAQEAYVVQNFLSGDNIVDNINAIRRRSDILRNIIGRTNATVTVSQLSDGGYVATFPVNSKYWMFLSGVLAHAGFSSIINNKGSNVLAVDLELINHYDLQKKVRTINNEPVLKKVPIVLEGSSGFVFYLGKEYQAAIGSAIDTCAFNIVYLKYPDPINELTQPSLAESTHYNIVELAVQSFIREYKYLLGSGQIKQ